MKYGGGVYHSNVYDSQTSPYTSEASSSVSFTAETATTVSFTPESSTTVVYS